MQYHSVHLAVLRKARQHYSRQVLLKAALLKASAPCSITQCTLYKVKKKQHADLHAHPSQSENRRRSRRMSCSARCTSWLLPRGMRGLWSGNSCTPASVSTGRAAADQQTCAHLQIMQPRLKTRCFWAVTSGASKFTRMRQALCIKQWKGGHG
eukprot:1160662-Pelagomonas_calceolata.AAC.2